MSKDKLSKELTESWVEFKEQANEPFEEALEIVTTGKIPLKTRLAHFGRSGWAWAAGLAAVSVAAFFLIRPSDAE